MSQKGVAGGVATLDDTGVIPASQLPTSAVDNFKGTFADEAAIVAAFATAETGDYAFNTETSSLWYWSAALASWVNSEITADAYTALSAAAKADVPYVIVP